MFTVNNEEEAKLLVNLACPKNYDNQHFAPELAEEQTLENLYAFGDRLNDIYQKILKRRRE